MLTEGPVSLQALCQVPRLYVKYVKRLYCGDPSRLVEEVDRNKHPHETGNC